MKGKMSTILPSNEILALNPFHFEHPVVPLALPGSFYLTNLAVPDPVERQLMMKLKLTKNFFHKKIG